MKKSTTVLLHTGCWLVLIGYWFSGNLLEGSISFGDIAFKVSIITVQIIEFYICYLWVYPRFLKPNRLLALGGGIFVALCSFTGLRYLIEEVLYRHWFGIHNYSENTTFLQYFADNLYWGTSFIVLAGAVWGVQHSMLNEKRNSRLREEVRLAELSFLRSQINPHFLYNTFNYIYSLAIPVSDKLANAVLRMSDLMRYTLSGTADGLSSLSREIEYLESYIELFKMRFEPEFYVNFHHTPVEHAQIAPLLLIPFVENAFKHGVVKDPAKPVKIVLKLQGKRLEFSISNKISHQQKDVSSGIGLANIQRRLDLIYPDRHELLISNNGQTYKTTLVIKLD